MITAKNCLYPVSVGHPKPPSPISPEHQLSTQPPESCGSGQVTRAMQTPTPCPNTISPRAITLQNEQWTNGEDQTNNNVVSGNTISTNANECVDIKEGATGNIVEYNSCTNQLDENSGCYDSRGDDNIFR